MPGIRRELYQRDGALCSQAQAGCFALRGALSADMYEVLVRTSKINECFSLAQILFVLYGWHDVRGVGGRHHVGVHVHEPDQYSQPALSSR